MRANRASGKAQHFLDYCLAVVVTNRIGGNQIRHIAPNQRKTEITDIWLQLRDKAKAALLQVGPRLPE